MAKTYRKLQVFNKSTDFRAATKLVETELIEPSENQLRVRNIWAGVNATDINITAGKYFSDGQLPFDIGLEALGVVDAIGKKISKESFKLGQPVLVVGNFDGFSEYVYADAEKVIPVPELKPEYLVSYINGLTASIGLDKAGHVKKDEKVLITAAAGGTGQIALQWAKHRGAYVIALTSSDAKVKYLKSLGANCVINYRSENLDKTLSEKFPNGIDVVWETIGGETFRTLSKHLAARGRLIIIGSITNYKTVGITGLEVENMQAKLLLGSQSFTGFLLFHYNEFFKEYLTELITKIHQGNLVARIDNGGDTGEKFFGLNQVWRAEEHLHSGKNIGKVVVQIQNVQN